MAAGPKKGIVHILKRLSLWGAILSGVFAISPFISAFIAGSIASYNGCYLDEGGVHPCVILGRDMGLQLYEMGVAAWFFLVTIPLGTLIGVFCIAAYLLCRIIISHQSRIRSL